MNAERAPVRAERGLLLPLLALVLAGGGVLGLGVLHGLDRDASGGRSDGGWRARRALLDARDALIAHAASYPESYGPLGAGPGHLVCPDADTPLDGRPGIASARAGGGFTGDGPNPPCGGGPLAVGRLPRHVSIGGGRRAFHHEPTQRFVYAVSSGYVNNPPGRAVHRAPEATSSDPGADVVAVVVDPGGTPLSPGVLAGARDPLELLDLVRESVRREAGASAARSLPHVFVTRGTLVGAAERRVAAWFVETATVVARRHGRGGSRALASHAGAASRDVAAFPGIACDEVEGDTSGWVGDDRSSTCTAPPATIENTPRERHWFVREGWSRDLQVRRDPACREAGAICRLVVARGDAGRGAGPSPVTARRSAAVVVELLPGRFEFGAGRRRR